MSLFSLIFRGGVINSLSFATLFIVKPETNKPKDLFAAFETASLFMGNQGEKAEAVIFKGTKSPSFTWSVLICATHCLSKPRPWWKYPGSLDKVQLPACVPWATAFIFYDTESPTIKPTKIQCTSISSVEEKETEPDGQI